MSYQITVIRTYEPTITVVHIPRQQPTVLRFPHQGPAGGGGGSSTINVTAGEALGGNRAVALNEDGEAVYADRADTSQAQKVLGITTTAISSGATGKVQTAGEMTEPSWNWDVTKPVFLSTLGNLTQADITSGFLLQIGIPTAPTKLLITLKQDFILI